MPKPCLGSTIENSGNNRKGDNENGR